MPIEPVERQIQRVDVFLFAWRNEKAECVASVIEWIGLNFDIWAVFAELRVVESRSLGGGRR